MGFRLEVVYVLAQTIEYFKSLESLKYVQRSRRIREQKYGLFSNQQNS